MHADFTKIFPRQLIVCEWAIPTHGCRQSSDHNPGKDVHYLAPRCFCRLPCRKQGSYPFRSALARPPIAAFILALPEGADLCAGSRTANGHSKRPRPSPSDHSRNAGREPKGNAFPFRLFILTGTRKKRGMPVGN
jgi:hypothetical protein